MALAPLGSQDTHRVIALADRRVVEDGLPYRPASWPLGRDHRVFVPFGPIQNWVEAGGKKAQSRMGTAFLNWALADCSGDVAVDELSDGPCWVLSAVDNRRDKRLLSEVLDPNPKRLEQQSADLFTHRHLFVTHHRSQSARKRFWHITRRLPQLRKVREIMAQVSALFDRRGRTQTALDKLAKLRRHLNRCKQLGESLKQLFSPTLEKVLVFLDDTVLPSRSNAVARGNRRYRKRQKSLDSVRIQEQIRARIALDLWRDAQGAGRDQTLQALHEARAGCT